MTEKEYIKDQVTVVIPVYNEIRFIRRTLESIINEADEILISDFGSTDGTLDVLEEFVSKYPKVIYANHKDWQFSDRMNWFFQNAHGKYVRLIGGHDMVSSGSTKSMTALLENNPDAVMVFSKYCIYLNQDYTFNSFYFMAKENAIPFASDSPFVRVQATANHFCLPSIYYGLYKKDVYFDAFNFLSSLFADGVVTDTGLLAAMLKRGKLICDDSSFFFWMKPRKDVDLISEYKRMSVTNSRDGTSSPFYWSFATICDCYTVVNDMQKLQCLPDNFNQISLDIFINMYSFLFDSLTEKITPAYIPQALPKYKPIYDEVFNAVVENLKNIENSKKQSPLFQSFCMIKKLIKCILPYGFVRLIQEIKKRFQ
ncbi:MAG: glycosyltransferase family 2 protein [Planctomycetaceae bacterium]|jgi:glycosyltransferase involved in cell wall biosynthesis|nr:glycosyltransferase family 2 protein [Planctomycetaceae bacterium]